jgi:hypothetical protein
MATLPATVQKSVGSKLSAADWNTFVKANDDFFIYNRPLCVLKQGTVQSLTTSTLTPITFDLETLDRDNQHSTATSTDRVVIGNTLGWYRVTGSVAYTGNAAGDRRAVIYLNGVATNGYSISHPSSTSLISTMVVGYVQATSATDYVQLYGWQSSGVALNTVVSGTFQSYLNVEWIGS